MEKFPSLTDPFGASSPGGQVIRTKLIAPRGPRNRVLRPRLVRRLNAAVDFPLTLISAPAGFGKTTLLSEWISSNAQYQKIPIAWISLDPRDNHLHRFAAHLFAALSGLSLDIQEADFHAWLSAGANLESLVTYVVNRLAGAPEPVVLILEDLHTIASEEVMAALRQLIEHLPPQMHLLISSRGVPALPLAGLRARQHLVELNADDLRFTFEEVDTFLNEKMGLRLPPSLVSHLASSTEGWIAGLQLAAVAMQGTVQPPSEPDLEETETSDRLWSFDGSHRLVRDYLAEQVLLSQPEAVQDFLLATCVLNRLNSSSCEAITGKPGAHPMLELLERSNLFLLPLDDAGHWFRYHHLFADFLRSRLQQNQPERWLELHTRAVEWYEQRGETAEAIDHVLALNNLEYAVNLIEQIAEKIWMSGEMVRLHNWLEAIPPGTVRSRPRLSILHAWILNIVGRFSETEELLGEAERNIQSDPSLSVEERTLLMGMHSTTQAILDVMKGDASTALQRSQKALESLPADCWIWKSVAIRNLGNAYIILGQTGAAEQAFQQAFEYSINAGSLYMSLVAKYELAELLMIRGQLHRAEQAARQALELAASKASPGVTIQGAPHLALAEIYREWNRLPLAHRHAQLAIEFGQRGLSLGVQVCGYTRLGLVEQDLGNPKAAAAAFEKAARLAPLPTRTSFLSHHEIQARLWVHLRDPGLAVQCLPGTRSAEEAPISSLDGGEPPGAGSFMAEAACIAYARLLIRASKTSQASKLLASLLPAAQSSGRTGRLIEILTLQAKTLQLQGQTQPAQLVLEQALETAQPEGYLRMFIDEGQPLLDALAALADSHSVQRGYAARLLSAARNPQVSNAPTQPPPAITPLITQVVESVPAAPEKQPSQALVEPLSEREREILTLIAAGYSNSRVAVKLVVAPSTIHWHVKNIYSKLDVHSRTQAVQRAKELRLIV